jgi:formylglycine-generating enzyme required for sulfatase activity
VAKIFISYRRRDSAGVTGRIYDRLCAHFGWDAVFMDIDSIPFGEDFRERIRKPSSDFAELAHETSSLLPAPTPSDSPQLKRLSNSLGMILARVEPGTFLMGTSKEQRDVLLEILDDPFMENFHDEQPQHRVEISRPFLRGIHQVTQQHYMELIGFNPSEHKGARDLPVHKVSWLDAVGFCNRLSESEQLSPFYRIGSNGEVAITDGDGYRLPTEAEWEYACRAQSTTVYPFGDDPRKLKDHAWYYQNSGRKVQPVGRRIPNCWGFHDMLGNVHEWCADWYDERYYEFSPLTDPWGGAEAEDRVLRGGAYDAFLYMCASAYRFRLTPIDNRPTVGCRQSWEPVPWSRLLRCTSSDGTAQR